MPDGAELEFGRALREVSRSARVFGAPDGKRWKDGDIWKNPDLARTLRRLVEAEKEAAKQGRLAGLKAARDRFYKGDIAREMAKFSGGQRRPVPLRGFRVLLRQDGRAGLDQLSRLRGLQEPLRQPRAGGVVRAQHPRRLRPEEDGTNSPDYIHTSVEAMKLAMADRDTYLGDMDFIKIPYTGLLSKDYAADRRKLIDPAKASLDFRPGEWVRFAGPGYEPSIDAARCEFDRQCRSSRATPAISRWWTAIAT